jgi:hypothetical protein
MSPLDAYRYATQRWQQANRETEQATLDRARALADMRAAGWDIDRIRRETGLAPARVEQLIAKIRPEGARHA